VNSTERVLAALSFRPVDRVPIYDEFSPQWAARWRRAKGLGAAVDPGDYYQIDMEVLAADETPFPSARGPVGEADGCVLERTGWGDVRCVRRTPGFEDGWVYPAQAFEAVQVALPEKGGLDALRFESPLLDSRYPAAADVADRKAKRCLFAKTGGPYLRGSYVRGAVQWLTDLAEDPAFARELALKIADHLAAVGLETMRRYDLYASGMWLDDDIGSNGGLMVSPATFERVFLPCYARMIAAYRHAGARFIIFHSDGNVESILDMLVDAGVDAINPLEYKAGMDAVRLRRQYGRRLAFIGGLDNAHVLPAGSPSEIEAHVRRLLSIAPGGGLIAGSHSISADVPPESYELAWGLIRAAGTQGGDDR
jgi:uroporphyrinogen decarboxylase